jgi:hypothetical protein
MFSVWLGCIEVSQLATLELLIFVLLWKDFWIDDQNLCDVFPQLFSYTLEYASKRTCHQHNMEITRKKIIWKSKTLPELRVFPCLLFMNRLNTNDIMARRNWQVEWGLICGLTRDHLFFAATSPFSAGFLTFSGIHLSRYSRWFHRQLTALLGLYRVTFMHDSC